MQVKSGTIFDNFLLTNDPNLAEEIGNETWGQTKVGNKLILLTIVWNCYLCTSLKFLRANRIIFVPMKDPEKKMKDSQEDEERKKREEDDQGRKEEPKEEGEEEIKQEEEDEDEEDEEEEEDLEEEEEEEEEGTDSQLKDEL